MHVLDEMIESLQNRVNADIRQQNYGLASLSHSELSAYREVRDGKPKDETPYHHSDMLYTYRQARATAEAMLNAKVQ